MILNIVEFMKAVGVKPLPGVMLFTSGKAGRSKKDSYEPYLVDQAVDKLIAAYVDPTLKDLSFTSFYAEEAAPGVVVEEARTLPFLAERRVVLVRNAGAYMDMASDKRSPLYPLLQFLENPPDASVLAMICPEVNRTKSMYKLCEKNGLIIECPQLTGAEYSNWIQDRFAQNGKTINARIVTSLVERVGNKMSDMNNAVNLVCNFAQSHNAITEEDVLAASADVAEATVWALTDAIAVSNPAAALKELHELLAMNKTPDEILGILNWLLESTYRAHPATPLKLDSIYLSKKVGPLTKKFSPARLAAALAMCTKTHFALRTTGADTKLQLELLVIKLAYARN